MASTSGSSSGGRSVRGGGGAPTASEEEQINSLVVEIRVLEGTFNELSARQNLLERALLETRAALESLKGLSESNPTEVLIPVGAGVLLRSSPPRVDEVLVNVGANVVIQRKRGEAVALLEARSREIENSMVSIVSQRNQIAARLDADRQALQTMASRQSQKN